MFRKEPKTTVYLYDTPIENIFLAEYMPEIPGDYLKVYLYAQMLAAGGEPAFLYLNFSGMKFFTNTSA